VATGFIQRLLQVEPESSGIRTSSTRQPALGASGFDEGLRRGEGPGGIAGRPQQALECAAHFGVVVHHAYDWLVV
jgi:hypothetical protein